MEEICVMYEAYKITIAEFGKCPACGGSLERPTLKKVSASGFAHVECRKKYCDWGYDIEGINVYAKDLIEPEEDDLDKKEVKLCGFCNKKCVYSYDGTRYGTIDSCAERQRGLLKRRFKNEEISLEQFEEGLCEIEVNFFENSSKKSVNRLAILKARAMSDVMLKRGKSKPDVVHHLRERAHEVLDEVVNAKSDATVSKMLDFNLALMDRAEELNNEGVRQR